MVDNRFSQGRHTKDGGFAEDGGFAGLGLLFLDEGARCKGFMMGMIINGGEAREMEEH